MTAIGNYEFEPGQTAVKIIREQVLGRVRKIVNIDAVLAPHHTLAEARADVEALEAELARLDEGKVTLQVVPGRYYEATRRDYSRHLNEESFAVAVHLSLLTEDAFERSTALHAESLNINMTGATLPVTHDGNTVSRPRLTITAMDTLVSPTISDGTRTLAYGDSLIAGEVLILDSDPLTAVLNGNQNVLHRMTGSFPLLQPGTTTLTYEDDAASSHEAALLVEFRDTWD